jgi:hypothetical protein
MLSTSDLSQIKKKGISTETIDKQIKNFKSGFPYSNLVKPAIISDGIISLNTDKANNLADFYQSTSGNKTTVKFVPASGAASRMFKALFEYLENTKESKQEDVLQKDKGFDSPYNFINKIKDFAFFDDLKNILKQNGFDLEAELKSKNYKIIIDHLVNKSGLDYGSLPKGLLKFHQYDNGNRCALEEHLVEAAHYAISKDKIARIHFTVSPEHMEKFTGEVENVKPKYEKELDVKFDISYSIQKPSTDTIAVDMDNEPFREADNTILFRPGGHGALIENLNEINGDVVFIKNIDNIVPDRLKPETILYKKAIGGLLLKLQNQIFDYLTKMEKSSLVTSEIGNISNFARKKLNITFSETFSDLSEKEKQDYLFAHLNRPIRICGMVKNEGEPGGGPFWVKNTKNEVSLQIVESSQIDTNNTEQKGFMLASTHFNPVDLVCGLSNYKGEQFDLHSYIDPETGFISIKSKNGSDLKAQELPGLWNGAMANWITLFVEVPIITFNPVKTVNDLLREQHQPGK